MRGIRFSVELDFGIEAETYNAMLELAPLIRNVSAERVTDEFGRALLADVFLLPVGLPIWRVIFPDLLGGDQPHRDAFLASLDWLHWKELYPDFTCRLAAFVIVMQGLGYPEGELEGWIPPTPQQIVSAALHMADRLRLSRQQQKQFAGILSVFQNIPEPDVMADDVKARYWLRRQIADYGQESTLFVLGILRFLARISLPQNIGNFSAQYINLLYRRLSTVSLSVLADSAPRSLKHLAVGGDDLIERGFVPGPALGNFLNKLFDAVLAEKVSNNYKDLMAYIDDNLEELLQDTDLLHLN